MSKCLRQVSQSKVVFLLLQQRVSLLLQQRFGIQTCFCNCLQYLTLFDIVVECNPNECARGKMLVLPNQLLFLVLSTSD